MHRHLSKISFLASQSSYQGQMQTENERKKNRIYFLLVTGSSFQIKQFQI